MFKQYFKQVIYQLKENKLISWISILGTAFSIAIIMVMVILFQIRNANYRPEVNRDRTLYVQFGERFWKNTQNINSRNFKLSGEVIQECFYPLTQAEAVCAIAWNSKALAIPGKDEWLSGQVSFTDAEFWKIFDFEFLSGKPFTKADYMSGIRKIVLTDEMARKLYQTTDVVGKTLYMQSVLYTVCGVVRKCSKWAQFAYADAYAPYSSGGVWMGEGMEGPCSCLILAPDKDSFEKIRQEVDILIERYNQKQSEQVLGLRGQPYTHFQQQFFVWDSQMPHVAKNVTRYAIILVILLLVPAINLSGLSLSRMRRRMQEIGIRRSFGANKWQIVSQVLNENLLFTLMGGILGILFSYLSIYLMNDWLLDSDPYISAEMVASPTIFILAFLFCLILNLLSAGIPAWLTAKKDITDILR